ncbi:MAG TPA: PDZ domain-containing protein [Phycisphaerales bacterium]|nr:PDZ domain-containing protein [Phycisphaerales bacterium]
MCLNETTDRWVKVAATLAFIAGTLSTLKEATAQDNSKEQVREREIRGDFDQRLDDDAKAEVQSNTTVSMTESIDGTSYSVRMQGGKTTVERDGKKVSKDRYRIEGNRVEFLDKDGEVEHTMTLPSVGNGGQNMWRVAPRAPRTPVAPIAPRALAQVENPPPVMLGITMSNDDDGARIDSVREGLPAEKAGLREGDVIIKIGDEDVSDQADVRAALKNHKADEKVDVIVLRDGDKKTIGVTLEAWDDKKLGVHEAPQVWTVPGAPAAPGVPGFEGDMNNWLRNFTLNMGEDRAETLRSVREALQAALEQVDGAKDDIEAMRKAAKDGLESAIKSLEEAEATAGEGHRMRLVVPGQNGDAQQFVIPRMQEEERARSRRDMERGSDDLRKQMEELRKQMQELREQLQQNKKDDR